MRFFCCLLNNLLFLNVGPTLRLFRLFETSSSRSVLSVPSRPMVTTTTCRHSLRVNSCSLHLVVYLGVHVDLLFLVHLPARLNHERFNGDTHRLLQQLKNFNNLVDGLQLRASRRFPVESTSPYGPVQPDKSSSPTFFISVRSVFHSKSSFHTIHVLALPRYVLQHNLTLASCVSGVISIFASVLFLSPWTS